MLTDGIRTPIDIALHTHYRQKVMAAIDDDTAERCRDASGGDEHGRGHRPRPGRAVNPSGWRFERVLARIEPTVETLLADHATSYWGRPVRRHELAAEPDSLDHRVVWTIDDETVIELRVAERGPATLGRARRQPLLAPSPGAPHAPRAAAPRRRKLRVMRW